MKTSHFVINTSDSGDVHKTIKDQRLTDAIARLVSQRKFKCECGYSDFIYEGLGKYTCKKCNKILYDNYGKVRQCIDNYGTISVVEVMEKTGLTKNDIRELEASGSIAFVNGKVSI